MLDFDEILRKIGVLVLSLIVSLILAFGIIGIVNFIIKIIGGI